MIFLTNDDRGTCPVCGAVATQEFGPPWLEVRCPSCGSFRITYPTVDALKECPSSSRWRVSSELCEASQRGNPLTLDLGELVRLMLGE